MFMLKKKRTATITVYKFFFWFNPLIQICLVITKLLYFVLLSTHCL